jgi:hypothetical protein
MTNLTAPLPETARRALVALAKDFIDWLHPDDQLDGMVELQTFGRNLLAIDDTLPFEDVLAHALQHAERFAEYCAYCAYSAEAAVRLASAQELKRFGYPAAAVREGDRALAAEGRL